MEIDLSQPLIGPGFDEIITVREALLRREDAACIDHRRVVAHHPGDAHQRNSDVDRADNDEMCGRQVAVEEDPDACNFLSTRAAILDQRRKTRLHGPIQFGIVK